MRFLLTTLSLSYLTRHLSKTVLTLLGVVVGVATFCAIRGAQGTLVTGIRGTVDRMAGKAQLQISFAGGVPEEIQESLREVPGILAQAPVIEQLVVAEPPEPAGKTRGERSEPGTLLLVGVDLLGDREMREYGFEGEDADLDDPLLFLAQPDSVALTRTFAERAGLKPGDTFRFRAPQGLKTVTVRGLLSPKGFAEAFGGNLVVMDVYAAQDLFGRGRRFDRIEVRLTEGTSLEAGTAALRQALGPSYQVETPARRSSQLEGLIRNFTVGFSITSGFALAIGTFLIFNAFSVAVNRRRRDVGTLRALGATPRQVQALFLLEALAMGAVGGVLGVLLGSGLAQAFLSVMGESVEKIYGLKDVSKADVTPAVILQSLVLGMVASLVGAYLPSRTAAAVHPTESLAKGSFQARVAPASRLRLVLGVLLAVFSTLVPFFPRVDKFVLIPLVLLPGCVGLTLLAGPAARDVLRRLSPLVSRLSPVAGQLAHDSLLGSPRRTSGTVVVMTLSLAFVLGTGGYMHATKATFLRWMDDVLTSDLYVRASANLVRPDFLFPGALRDELRAVPGVRAVESFRGLRFPYRGDTLLLATIEIEPMLDRTRHEFLQGDAGAMRQGLVRERRCAISDNLHRRFGLNVGDAVEVPTPKGVVSIPVGVIFLDYSSDQGTLFVDRAYFLELFGDDRVDTFDVSLAAGADPLRVREGIRKALAGRMPALISTRREFTQEIGQAVDAFYSLIRITVFLALLVAFLGIVTSLLIAVAERTREIGILKSLGALGPQIASSVVFEALTVGFVGLLLALPAGDLIARFMEGTLCEAFAGWRMPHAYPWDILAMLGVALPTVSALAAWIPARQAARVKVTEAIEYE